MAKPSNPENRYSFTCKVSGETVKTNPKQFSALATRYGITNEELDVSYVSRAGRRVITDEKLSPEQAVEKYGIHLNVAKTLKCTVKEKVKKEKTPSPTPEQTDAQAVEAVQNTSIEVTETPETPENTFVESYSNEVSEENSVTA
jgi:hypothetical protein